MKFLNSRRMLWLMGPLSVLLLLFALALSSPPGDQWRAIWQIRARGGTVSLEAPAGNGLWGRIQSWFPDAFGQVRSVSLTDARVSRHILQSMSNWKSLRQVWLNRCSIVDEDLRFLNGMTDLNELYLNGNLLTDAAFLQLGKMNELRRLEVNWTRVKDLELLHSQYCTLMTLKLRGTPVTDADLEGLLPDTGWLVHLDLSKTAVTDAGLRRLNKVNNLREIDLEGTPTTVEAIDRFHQHKPYMSITRPPHRWLRMGPRVSYRGKSR